MGLCALTVGSDVQLLLKWAEDIQEGLLQPCTTHITVPVVSLLRQIHQSSSMFTVLDVLYSTPHFRPSDCMERPVMFCIIGKRQTVLDSFS